MPFLREKEGLGNIFFLGGALRESKAKVEKPGLGLGMSVLYDSLPLVPFKAVVGPYCSHKITCWGWFGVYENLFFLKMGNSYMCALRFSSLN